MNDNFRILVVDNERAVAEGHKLNLELSFPGRIDIATSGEQALEMMNKANYRIVITDIDMGLGKMTGIDLTRKIRETRETNSVKIICLSGKNLRPDGTPSKEAVTDAKGDIFIEKTKMPVRKFLALIQQYAAELTSAPGKLENPGPS